MAMGWVVAVEIAHCWVLLLIWESKNVKSVCDPFRQANTGTKVINESANQAKDKREAELPEMHPLHLKYISPLVAEMEEQGKHS